MSVVEPQSAVPEPNRPGFYFSLARLLLLFALPGSSLGVFGAAGGIVVFGLVLAVAIDGRQGCPVP